MSGKKMGLNGFIYKGKCIYIVSDNASLLVSYLEVNYLSGHSNSA